MSKPKYDFDISIQSLGECDFRDGCWLGYESVSTFGNTLEELFENAEVFTSDQDGGEGPSRPLSDMGNRLVVETIESLIKKEYEKESRKLRLVD